MRISVVIPNLNGAHFLSPCLKALFAQKLGARELEVIVVDNASTDGSVALIEQNFSQCRLLRNTENLGFTPAINQGAAAAGGDWLLLLNNDTEMRPGALDVLAGYAESGDETLAGVQPLLLRAKNPAVIDSAGIALAGHFRARDDLNGESVERAPSAPCEIFGPCAGCALIRKDYFDRAGGFDPDFFAEFDDVDFSLRVRWLGGRFMIVPDARVLHHRSPTSNRLSRDKRFRHHRNQLWTGHKSLPRGLRRNYLFYRLQRDFFMLPSLLRRGLVWDTMKSWRELSRLAPVLKERRIALLRSAELSHREMRGQLKRFMHGSR